MAGKGQTGCARDRRAGWPGPRLSSVSRFSGGETAAEGLLYSQGERQ